MPLLSVEHTYAALWAWGRVVRMQGSLREASRPTQVLPSLRDTRTTHTHRSSINRPVMYVRVRVCVGRLRIAECPPDAESRRGREQLTACDPQRNRMVFFTHIFYIKYSLGTRIAQMGSCIAGASPGRLCKSVRLECTRNWLCISVVSLPELLPA